MEKLGDFQLKGDTLLIKDSMILLDEDKELNSWPVLTLSSGDYIIQAAYNDERLTTVRFIKNATMDVHRGNRIGTVDVDMGSISFIDYEMFHKVIIQNYDTYADWTEDELEPAVWEKPFASMKFKGEQQFVVSTTIGDGCFPLYPLLSDGVAVGVECDIQAVWEEQKSEIEGYDEEVDEQTLQISYHFQNRTLVTYPSSGDAEFLREFIIDDIDAFTTDIELSSNDDIMLAITEKPAPKDTDLLSDISPHLSGLKDISMMLMDETESLLWSRGAQLEKYTKGKKIETFGELLELHTAIFKDVFEK